MFDNPWILEKDYGKKFPPKLRALFDHIASGGNDEYILVKNDLDKICYMCPLRRKRKTCKYPDSLSLWYSGYVMQEMNLREGFLYPIGEFMERVKRLYPDRNPVGK